MQLLRWAGGAADLGTTLPLRDGRRVREAVEDVRIALCREHLAEGIFRRRLLLKDGWAYG